MNTFQVNVNGDWYQVERVCNGIESRFIVTIGNETITFAVNSQGNMAAMPTQNVFSLELQSAIANQIESKYL